MDRLTRAEHFRKMAVRYEELAKVTLPACLSNFYRSYAVRYGLMAQEASERAESEENAAMRVLKNDFGWSLIDTVPFDQDVMLEVTDGQGEPTGYAIHAGSPRPDGSARARGRRSSSHR
jgi:hypothetical protein